MYWFYFLLLIPLTSGIRRFDEPNRTNGARRNKPILRMPANADYSEFNSGENSLRSQPPTVKNPVVDNSVSSFFSWLFSQWRNRGNPLSLRAHGQTETFSPKNSMESKGSEKDGKPVLHKPSNSDESDST